MIKTLALNMIVGPGDAHDLEQCLLSFDAKTIFDEIVICITTGDDKVKEVAEKYADKICFFKWSTKEHPFGDFGGARNVALENTESDYVMWLDCDDRCEENKQQAMFSIKNVVTSNNYDYYKIPYLINDGTQTLSKERIFKRCETIKWKRKVHEMLTIYPDYHTEACINGLQIVHSKTADVNDSIRRNIRVLKSDFENLDSVDRYYYAIESLNYIANTGEVLELDKNEAVNILKEIYKGHEFGIEAHTSLAQRISEELLYTKKYDVKSIVEENIIEAETYACMAIANETLAEPYIVLGDMHLYKEEISEAIRCYSIAMNKSVKNTSGLANVAAYKKIPLMRLVDCYRINNNVEMSLYYNRQLLDIEPENEFFLNARKELKEELL